MAAKTKAQKAETESTTTEEPRERKPAVSQLDVRKAIDVAVMKRLKQDKGSSVSFGRILDSCVAAHGRKLPSDMVLEQLLALVGDGKITRAEGECHFYV